MHFEVLIHPKGVERCGIEARQEHIDNNEQIDFTLLNLIGQVFVVVLEPLARCIKVSFECLIVISDCHIQKITGTLVKSFCVKALVIQNTIGAVFFILGKGVNSGNGQISVLLCNLFFQFQIILFASRNGAYCKHGVKSVYSLTFQTVIRITHRLLVKVFQNVLHDLRDTLR